MLLLDVLLYKLCVCHSELPPMPVVTMLHMSLAPWQLCTCRCLTAAAVQVVPTQPASA